MSLTYTYTQISDSFGRPLTIAIWPLPRDYRSSWGGLLERSYSCEYSSLVSSAWWTNRSQALTSSQGRAMRIYHANTDRLLPLPFVALPYVGPCANTNPSQHVVVLAYWHFHIAFCSSVRVVFSFCFSAQDYTMIHVVRVPPGTMMIPFNCLYLDEPSLTLRPLLQQFAHAHYCFAVCWLI